MNRTITRACLTGLVLAGLAAGATPARAAAPQVALSPFQGPGAEQLRTSLIARLPGRLRVLPLAQSQRADALVEGQIWTGKLWKVQLVVRHSRTGAPAGTLVWSGAQPRALIAQVLREAPPKLEAKVKVLTQAMVRRQTVVRSAAAVPAATEADTDTDADADETPAARTEDKHAAVQHPVRRGSETPGPLLEVSVGAGTIGRTLTFADNLAAAPGYSLPAASTLGGEAVVFPGTRLGGWMGLLGISGAWESSIAARTAGKGGDDGGQGHPTRHLAYSFGARGRLPLARASLVAGLDLGQQRFEVDLPGATLSPAMRYRFLRPSLAGRVLLDDFALSLSAGYLRVLSSAGMDGVFPRAQVRGFELGARLGYSIADDLAVDLRLDFRRFAHDMNARPGDAMLVGGAVDDYLTAALRLTYRVW